MDDLGNYKIIVYIVLAILYFLFTGKKKTTQKTPPPEKQKETREEKPPVYKPKPIVSQPKTSSSRPASIPENPEPYSLEDILRQFGQTPEKPKSQEIKEVKNELLEKPKTSIIDYDENLEDEEEQLNKNKKSRRISVEDTNKENHLIPYVTEKQVENKYAALLKDPEGVKTAFIAGEIFNRKF